MPEPALTIAALALHARWAELKRRDALQVNVNGTTIHVSMVTVPSKIGAMRYLVCPHCSHRRRSLFLCAGPSLACRLCIGLRHPDQTLGTRWERDVIRPVRQLRRLDARLARTGLGRVKRRRLRRRRARLLVRLAQGLAVRQLTAAAQVLAQPVLQQRRDQ